MCIEQESDIAVEADAEIAAMRMQAAELQARVDGYSSRHLEMQELMQQFQLQQYLAMGAVVEKCLSLRRDYCRLTAFRSGSAADLAAARRADAELEDYHRGHEAKAVEAETDQAALAPEEIDELKKLYRTAVMRCHPDRVGDDEKDSAHDIFLRTQQAYREGDLEALRLINAQLAGVRDVALCSASDRASLKLLIAHLGEQGADLLLAIQSFQLDSLYRVAARKAEWKNYFTEVREQFEAECVELTERIRACSAA